MKGKVYISGPVSGLDKEEVRRRFAEAECNLRRNGYDVFNPCRTHLPPEATHGMYMNQDVKQMPYCDIVYFLRGWERSHGCRYEHQLALATERRICYEDPASYTLPTLSKEEIFERLCTMIGLTPGHVRSRNNRRKYVSVRMAVVSYLYFEKRFSTRDIADVMHRSLSGIGWLLRNRLRHKDDVEKLLQLCNRQEDILPYATPEEG